MKLILSIYLFAASFAFSAGLSFSGMEDGDKIEVSEHSKGCFHDATSYYEITKTNGTYVFRELAISWDKSTPPKVLEKKTIGTIELTQNDIVGLDGLLKFYRGKKEASSTTQVSLLFQFYDNKGVVTPEALKDGSGGYGLEQMKDVVTFYQLTKRCKNVGAE